MTIRKKTVTMELSLSEAEFLYEVVNEICHGELLGVGEFETRVGFKREMGDPMMDRLLEVRRKFNSLDGDRA